MFRHSVSLGILIVVVTAGCAAPQAAPAQQAVTLTPIITATAAPSATPTEEPEQIELESLTIWFPDSLLPMDDDAISAIIEAELSEFSSAQGGITIDVRRKAESDVGGIMATLRSASSVAPGALPDITLLRRDNLLKAVDDGLIQPIEGRVGSAVIADLYPAALRLGRAEDQLYGLPYLADVYVFAYRAEGEPVDRMTFDAVLELSQPLVIPAASPNRTADVLWLQYIAAGGILEADTPLTEAAVEAVFSFYDVLRRQDLIVPGSVDYTAPTEYARGIANGQIASGVVSTSLLALFDDSERPSAFASLPTSTGNPVSTIDAWMWVIVTQNTERQALAGRFINWMLEAERHSTYAQAVSIPPTQRNALRRWSFPGLDNSLLSELMTTAVLTDQLAMTTSAARSLQAAWIDVINGELNAQEAVRNALQP